MVDYVGLAAMALELVRDAGRSIAVQKLSTTPSDVAKPWRGPADQRSPLAATATVPACAVPLSGIGKLVDKNGIPDGIEDFYIVAPELATPDLLDYDEVVDEGATYRIAMVQRLRPADVTLLYVIGVVK